MPDELINTEAPVTTIVATAIVDTGTPPEGKVDLAPDPAALKADIDRLKETKEKAKADAEYWRRQKAEARADYFRTRKVEEPPAPPPSAPSAPHKEDFDDYDKYVDALTDYKVEKARAKWAAENEQRNTETTHQQRMVNLQTKMNEGIKKYPDFEEVAMAPEVPITPIIVDILAESEMPHDVAYYLGKNRAEAIRISHMTPIQAAREIAKIEVEIAKAGNPPPVPIPPKITGAPPPIVPVGSANPVTKDPEKMSPKEFDDWLFNQQKVKRF